MKTALTILSTAFCVTETINQLTANNYKLFYKENINERMHKKLQSRARN